LRPPPSDHTEWLPKPNNSAVNVMVVDDSLTVRTVFTRMVTSDASLNLVATASTAETAIEQLASFSVDVILLDLEMPGMGGIKALPALIKASQGAKVLVVSSLTKAGAKQTLDAMALGAADTMLKPRSGGFDEAYRLTLLSKIRALGIGENTNTSAALPVNSQDCGIPLSTHRTAQKRPEIVAFGASTGGIHALNIVLSTLPKKFDLPIVITQHLPASFVPIFARQINDVSGRTTLVADEGTRIERGMIAIAAGDAHMEFTRTGEIVYAKSSDKPAISGCLPSVDPMLSSLARVYDGRVLGVILSGMGRDGVHGASELAALGGTIIAQDAASSAVWGMPGAVTKAGLTSACLPPEEIANAIVFAAGSAAWK
ncbi:MAG: chemotaxis-specific protein-glutamate methyltransferase CheB, partial [Marinomonas sp.]